MPFTYKRPPPKPEPMEWTSDVYAALVGCVREEIPPTEAARRLGLSTRSGQVHTAYHAIIAALCDCEARQRELVEACKALLELHIAHHNHMTHAATRAAIAKAEGKTDA